MHRWFFANDEIFCKSATPPPTSQSEASRTSSALSLVDEKNWIFRVQTDWQLCSNECLALSGSCASLGNWDIQSSLPLKRSDHSSFWTLTAALPRNSDVRYRYFLCALDEKGRKIVRFWETHFGGRLISHDQFQIINSIECEMFGVLNNKLKIERGWLNQFVTVVQFKFYQAPFELNVNQTNLLFQLKITPIKLKASKKCEKLTDPLLKAGVSERFDFPNEAKEENSGESFAFCEVASLQEQSGEFRKQPKYGTACGPEDSVVFNLTLNILEQCAFLIDLFNIPQKSGSDVPPIHFGYQYVFPQDLGNSEGTLDLPVMCGTRHRPKGYMKCDYLVVKPMPSANFNLEKSFQRHWNATHQGLFIGHRGCGQSFWLRDNILRENTKKSFNLAIQHGADMIEFDVQLTKDLVPVLYHDPQLCVSQDFDIDLREHDIIHLPLTEREIDELKSSRVTTEKDFSFIPLSKFTLEQLRRVEIYEPPKAETHKTACMNDTRSNHPFPTLEQVLKEVDNKTGFVVEIKWPQIVIGDTKQITLVPDFDKNEYVDVILSVVFRNAGSRRIIFSSFDPDICTLIRLKQNLYPIMFSIKPDNERIFMDPRGKYITSGISFALIMEFLAVCINCADILEMPEKVDGLHERGLCVFSWGPETRCENTRKHLKTLGVDGIVCDRINHVLKPLDLKNNFVYIVPLKKQQGNKEYMYKE